MTALPTEHAAAPSRRRRPQQAQGRRARCHLRLRRRARAAGGGARGGRASPRRSPFRRPPCRMPWPAWTYSGGVRPGPVRRSASPSRSPPGWPTATPARAAPAAWCSCPPVSWPARCTPCWPRWPRRCGLSVATIYGGVPQNPQVSAAAQPRRHHRRLSRPAGRPHRAGPLPPRRRRDQRGRRGGPHGRSRVPARRAATAGHDPGRGPADAVLRHARQRRRRPRPAFHEPPGASMPSTPPRRRPRWSITCSPSHPPTGPGWWPPSPAAATGHWSSPGPRTRAQRLARQLTAAGIPAAELHGNLGQRARERNLASFAAGAVRVMVATDIAARGIHVDGIDLVIHADSPAEHKAYLHRSGRTARAGAAGLVITLQTPAQAGEVRALMRKARVVPLPPPSRPAPRCCARSPASPPRPSRWPRGPPLPRSPSRPPRARAAAPWRSRLASAAAVAADPRPGVPIRAAGMHGKVGPDPQVSAYW